MCFTRRSHWREEGGREGRRDPLWDLFYRETGPARPQPISAEGRDPEREAEEARDEASAGVGSA